MPLAVYVLSIGAFVICTSEFVIMGLLPSISTALGASLPQAGFLVTGYALGVVIGAPLLTPLISRRRPRQTLVWLMGLFLAGNLACGLAPTYSTLLGFRLVTALAHASFFGIGSVVAGRLAPPGKQASAIAAMFLGATLATILGVPVGTALGQAFGWRSTFLTITAVAAIAIVCIARFIPDITAERDVHLGDEFAALMRAPMARALITTVLGNGGPFVLLTYISPFMMQVFGIRASLIPIFLFVFGAGMVIGNPIGGRLADYDNRLALQVTVGFLMIVLIFCGVIFPEVVLVGLAMLLFGAATFAVIPPLQTQVLAEAGHAPTLAAATNIAAFNLGNAMGAWIGGIVVGSQWGLFGLPWAAASFSAVGLALTFWPRRKPVSGPYRRTKEPLEQGQPCDHNA